MTIQKIYEKLSVVIPAYNEADRFEYVLGEVLKVPEVSEAIFVDDGSSDDTEEKIKPFLKDNPRLVYLRHRQNKGKGAALKSGIKKARNEVILFLDADLKNITARKIKIIAMPVLTDQVDVSRGSFRRKRGRVTEYAVKPMMKILFPEIYFEQPISGQICAKKSFLETLDFEDKYGVDIGILFDAINSGQRIVEVDIGKLDHKANPEENIAEMSRQVLETMIKKAGLIQHKYKMVVFTLDNTLIQKDSLRFIFEKLKLTSEFEVLSEKLRKEEIAFPEFATSVASLLKGVSAEKISKICDKVPLAKYAPEVITALKKRKYRVAILSSNFSPIVLPLAKRLGIDLVDCIYLEGSDDVLKGKISAPSRERWFTEGLEKAFQRGLNRILRKTELKCSEAIAVANSSKALPLIKAAGLGIAYRPSNSELKDHASKTISLLPELLAIIE
ncbi:MAG TPA: HAD-IB family phosphatase [bacterium]|nr:HAD-IB family phosphatase [bacterium]